MNEKVQHQQMIERIKKCLKLAKSANPNEAAVALRQAQMLMQRCGLTTADVDMAGITEVEQELSAHNLPAWHHHVIRIVADAFGCEVVISHLWPKPKIKFIGDGARAEIAAYTYVVLRRHILGARKVFIAKLPGRCKPRTKTLRADSYCEGFVYAISEKVSALSLDDNERQAITTYMAKKHPHTQTARPTRNSSKEQKRRARQPDYSAAGYLDGKKVALHRAMRGSTQRPAKLEYTA